MTIDDFRFMWRGTPLRSLSIKQASLLAPIDIRRQNKGHALLLLHGFSSSPAVFRELLPAFTMYDAIICPVLPGHADSIASFAKSHAQEWLNTAEHACAVLCKNYQTVDVLGLSLGGILACDLSKRFALNHLYLLAPSLDLYLNIRPALLLAHALKRLGFVSIRNFSGNFHSENNSELGYRRLPINAVIEILTFIKNFEFIAPDCPTDLFVGSFDEVVNSSKVAQRFTDLANVKTHWLRNSAHVLSLDGDIDSIVSCVESNWPQGRQDSLPKGRIT